MPHYFRLPALTITAGLIAFLMITMPGCSNNNDIAGAWKGKITLPQTGNSLSDLKFSLTQDGNTVTGLMLFSKPGSKLPLTGTITGVKITLSSPMTNGLSVSINAVRENPKTIKGTALLNYALPQQGKKQDNTLLEMTR
jgi:hypothetical protein